MNDFDRKLPKIFSNLADSQKFIDRLEADLEGVLKEISTVHAEIKDYEITEVILSKIKNLNVGETFEARINIGKSVFVSAEVTKSNKILIKMCEDLFAELTYERAEVYVSKRIDILKKKVKMLEDLAFEIKARLTMFVATMQHFSAESGIELQL